MKKFDVVIVGSGAGLMLAEAALQSGKTCALIEQSKFGGTCLTKGCIPSKMLVYPADLIREAEKSDRVGLGFPPPQVDWDRISARMWKQINVCEDLEQTFRSLENLEVYKGAAEFTGKTSMRAKYADGSYSEEFQGEIFILAAGARSFIPPIKDLEQTGYVAAESFFGENFPKKPWDSLIIVGGGAIGAEFAHIFSALGTKVTLIEGRPRILPAEEEEISAFVEAEFKSNGIRVLTDCNVLSSGKSGSKKILTLEDNKARERRVIEADEIFIAAGIRSNSDSLHLEHTDVETDARGWIRTDGFLETSQKNVYAIGDINGQYQFRHTANYEAEILSQNLFGDSKKMVCYNAVPWAVFTWPQVAHVGMTEAEAKRAGRRYWVGRNYFSKIAGGIAMGISEQSADNGFIKIIIGEEKTILGVHIAGPHAAILVQPFVYLMNANHVCHLTEQGSRLICPPVGSYTPINDSMVIHPSLNELTAWVLGNIDWAQEG